MGIKKTEVCGRVFDVLKLQCSHESRALLLIDGECFFICMRQECQVVVLIGSSPVCLNVHVMLVTTSFLSSKY